MSDEPLWSVERGGWTVEVAQSAKDSETLVVSVGPVSEEEQTRIGFAGTLSFDLRPIDADLLARTLRAWLDVPA